MISLKQRLAASARDRFTNVLSNANLKKSCGFLKKKEINSSVKTKSRPTMIQYVESLNTLQTLVFKDLSRFSLLNHQSFASCSDKLWRLSSESKFDSLSTMSPTSRSEQRLLKRNTHISSNLLIAHSSTEQRLNLSTTVIWKCTSMRKTCLCTSKIALMLQSRWVNFFTAQTFMSLKASSFHKVQQKIILEKNSKRKLQAQHQSRLLTSPAMSLPKTLLI